MILTVMTHVSFDLSIPKVKKALWRASFPPNLETNKKKKSKTFRITRTSTMASFELQNARGNNPFSKKTCCELTHHPGSKTESFRKIEKELSIFVPRVLFSRKRSRFEHFGSNTSANVRRSDAMRCFDGGLPRPSTDKSRIEDACRFPDNRNSRRLASSRGPFEISAPRK